jgi:RNA polymerase sigma factor (sigma-70 family)
VAEIAYLVKSAALGDSDAWTSLVERFAGLIWSIARSCGLSPTDASDVSQTTWLRFAERIGDLRDPARAGAWLATTAKRESIRVSRLDARHVLVNPWTELDDLRGDFDDADTDLLTEEQDLVVHHAVALLPTRCRQLLLALAEDPPTSYAEISKRYDIPVGSIGPQRARCLVRLQRLIRGLEEDMSRVPAVAETSP